MTKRTIMYIFLSIIAILIIPSAVSSHGDIFESEYHYLRDQYETMKRESSYFMVKDIDISTLKSVIQIEAESNLYDNSIRFPNTKVIQNFLMKYNSPFKFLTFFENDTKGGQITVTGADIISDACDSSQGFIDCRIFLTLLELKTNGLTTQVSIEEVDRILSSIPGFGEGYAKSLHQRLILLGALISEAEQEYESIVDTQNLLLKFHDGTYRRLPPSTSKDVYVIERAMSQLASSVEEWERWHLGSADSFVSVYDSLFGEITDTSTDIFGQDTDSTQNFENGFWRSQKYSLKFGFIIIAFISIVGIISFWIFYQKK